VPSAQPLPQEDNLTPRQRLIHWLEQLGCDLPGGNDWLSAEELGRANGMRVEKRRKDWLLGRWTAKNAVAFRLNLGTNSLAEIELRAVASGAPEVFVRDKRAEISISLSHRAGRAICTLADRACALGCDIELIEPHSEAFLADYFTADEQALLAQAAASEKSLVSTLLWSAKESALKALGTGLRADTRTVSACPAPASPEVGGWHPLEVWSGAVLSNEERRWGHRRYKAGKRFQGWWQTGDGFVRTVVSDPAGPPPVYLKVAP